MAVEFSDFQRLAWYYQALIVVGLAGGLLGGYWYQFLTPIEDEIVTKEAQVITLQQEIAAAVLRRQQLAQLKAESLELQERLDGLKTVLPLERETDEIIRQVEQAARDSSMRILRFSPGGVTDHEVYSEYPINMQVESTYHNMGLFLDRIRQLPRIVNISSLHLSASGDGITTSIAATYVATTFVYREEDPVPVPAPAN